jgi:hypothetical protein
MERIKRVSHSCDIADRVQKRLFLKKKPLLSRDFDVHRLENRYSTLFFLQVSSAAKVRNLKPGPHFGIHAQKNRSLDLASEIWKSKVAFTFTRPQS